MKTIIPFLLLLCCVCAPLAQPVQVVVPNNLANVEGNSSASDILTAQSFRMQMVFDASQFGSLSSSPNVMNALSTIAFRIDGASTFDVLSGFGGASVTLSITLRGPDNLSPVFADNIGANPVTIYSGAASFGGGFIAGQNPQPFGNAIPVTEPFFYSPSQGNLLLDIVAGSGHVLFPGALDAQSTPGDSVSRVFANSEEALSGNVDTLGPVARFNFVIVPEPSTWILATVGLIMVFVLRRSKGHRQTPCP